MENTLRFAKDEVSAASGRSCVRALIAGLASLVVPDLRAIQVRAMVDPLVVRVVLPRLDQRRVVLQSAGDQFDESQAVGKVRIDFGEQLERRLATASERNRNLAERLQPRRNSCFSRRSVSAARSEMAV
jgi:hypothetical protein